MNWMYRQMKPLIMRATVALVLAVTLIVITDIGKYIDADPELVKLLGTVISLTVYVGYVVKEYISIYEKFKRTMKAFGARKEVKNIRLTEVAKQTSGYTTYKVDGDVELDDKIKTVSKYLSSTTPISTANLRLYSYFDPQDITGNTYFFDTDVIKNATKKKSVDQNAL